MTQLEKMIEVLDGDDLATLDALVQKAEDIEKKSQLVAQSSQVVDARGAINIGEQFIGNYVIIRTYSAGVWCGVLQAKDPGSGQIILTEARRMWRWWAKQSISLSAVSVQGIKENDSKICEPLTAVWLEAIEILPTSQVAEHDLRTAKVVEAE